MFCGSVSLGSHHSCGRGRSDMSFYKCRPMGENFGVRGIFPLQYHKWPLEQMSVKVNDLYLKAFLAQGPTTSIRCTLVQWNCLQSRCFVGKVGVWHFTRKMNVGKNSVPDSVALSLMSTPLILIYQLASWAKSLQRCLPLSTLSFSVTHNNSTKTSHKFSDSDNKHISCLALNVAK